MCGVMWCLKPTHPKFIPSCSRWHVRCGMSRHTLTQMKLAIACTGPLPKTMPPLLEALNMYNAGKFTGGMCEVIV